MATRILSSLYMLPLLYLLYLGGIPMCIAGAVLLCQGLKEYRNAVSTSEFKLPTSFIYILPLISLFIGIDVLNSGKFICSILFITAIWMILIMLSNIRKNIKKSIGILFGVIYIVVGIQSIVYVRILFENGLVYSFLIFVITVVCDSMAYFTGKLFGKTKLCPDVSPNKTIEGSVGGVIFTIIACIVYGNMFSLNISFMVFVGFLGSIICQIGDLMASKLKRLVKIKDFSNLIPGHGGVLDRLDSALMVSQFIFFTVLVLS